MKRLIFFITLMLLSLGIFAQEKMDSIYFKDGTAAAVTITVNFNDKIEFKYPGEELTNVYDKSSISRIVFKSGRVENVLSVSAADKIEKKTKSLYEMSDSDMEGIVRSFNKDFRYSGNLSDLYYIAKAKLIVKLSRKVSAAVADADLFSRSYSEAIVSGTNAFLKSYGGKPYDFFTISDTYGPIDAILYLVDYDANDGETYGFVYFIERETQDVVFLMEYDCEGGRGSTYVSQSLDGVSRNLKLCLKPYVGYMSMGDNLATPTDNYPNKERLEGIGSLKEWQRDLYMKDYMLLLENNIKAAKSVDDIKVIGARFTFLRMYDKEFGLSDSMKESMAILQNALNDLEF